MWRVFGRKDPVAHSFPVSDSDKQRFSVVDVETTGFLADGHDRIVEIAIVSLAPDGGVQDEYVTLVNPERDIGATRIHGITSGDVAAAPRFREIAGDVAERIAETVLVAHNARFDVGFLMAEFGRVASGVPLLPAVCTLRMARASKAAAPPYRLTALCERFGIALSSAHSALDDAKATARLFHLLLADARRDGRAALRELGCTGLPVGREVWPPLAKGGAVLTRQSAHIRAEPAYLARLVTRLQPMAIDQEPEALEYIDLLDRVLEDRVVTEQEQEALLATAAHWGLTQVRVLQIHQSYMEGVIQAALEDGTITQPERRDLERIGRMFGYESAALDEMITAARSGAGQPSPSRPARPMAGLTVCFTGESSCSLEGEPISRPLAQKLATDAGMIVKSSVTKKLDLLVTADPDSLSGKAQKARKYGIRVVAEKVFWDMLGVAVQ